MKILHRCIKIKRMQLPFSLGSELPSLLHVNEPTVLHGPLQKTNIKWWHENAVFKILVRILNEQNYKLDSERERISYGTDFSVWSDFQEILHDSKDIVMQFSVLVESNRVVRLRRRRFLSSTSATSTNTESNSLVLCRLEFSKKFENSIVSFKRKRINLQYVFAFLNFKTINHFFTVPAKYVVIVVSQQILNLQKIY